MPDTLSASLIEENLGNLPGWSLSKDRKAIRKSFRFQDFSAAWSFMTRAALLAEKMNHHPDWSNAYNRVDVMLTTHGAGGVTDRDVRMARAMESYAATG